MRRQTQDETNNITRKTLELLKKNKSSNPQAFVFMLSRFSGVQPFVTPWILAREAPLSMGFSGQVYWSGLPCPSSGALPDPRITLESPTSPALAGGFFTTSATWEALSLLFIVPILNIYYIHRYKT